MEEPEKKDPGAGIVLRGLLMLGLVLVLVAGGYTILLRKPPQTPPPPRPDPALLAATVAQPFADYPANIDWAALQAFGTELPSMPGWQIRYTAARNLARLGSKDVPWQTFAELLDENQQMRNFQVRLKVGRLVADETAARQIILSGLKALDEWQQKQGKEKVEVSADLAQVYRAVDKLAESPILEIRTQAEKTKARRTGL